MSECYTDKCGETNENPQVGDCCVIEDDKGCHKGVYIQTGHSTTNGVTTPILGCDVKSKSKPVSWWAIIIGLLLIIGACYLSWSCNSAMYKDMGMLSKGIKAFFAALFAPLYLVLYFFLWQGECSKARSKWDNLIMV